MKIDNEYKKVLDIICLDLAKDHIIMIKNYADMYVKLEIDIDDVIAFLKGMISHKLISASPEFSLTHCDDCKLAYNHLMLRLLYAFSSCTLDEMKKSME
jgi:hypothetical protein